MKLSDFRKLPAFALEHRLAKLTHNKDTLDEYDGAGEEPTDDLTEAEVVTSQIDDPASPFLNNHRPFLDIDLPVAVLPSSTEGHHHLYIDKEMTWTQYSKLLKVLAEVGIIEDNYAKASLTCGHTAIRLPWIKKATKAGVPNE